MHKVPLNRAEIVMVTVIVTGCNDVCVNLWQFIAKHIVIRVYDDLCAIFSGEPEARMTKPFYFHV
jgi:hypothetical protein